MPNATWMARVGCTAPIRRLIQHYERRVNPLEHALELSLPDHEGDFRIAHSK